MNRRALSLRAASAATALLLCAAAQARATTTVFKLPHVHHVFVIVLENEGYASTFGAPLADPYLAQTLPAQGALLESYYATGHASNDNYISLVSGQPPNAQNQADCPWFDNFTGALMLETGVEAGTGCVYPAEVSTIGTQLSAAKRSWKAYMGDMGNDPNRETAACGHPSLESTDGTQKAETGDGYATRHDPFVYFHSVIDETRFCDKHVVALGGPHGEMPAAALHGETGLATDLSASAKTPESVVHHTEPMRRRPRLSLHEPVKRHLGTGRHRHLPGNLGAENHELARLPAKRLARDRLRRGRQFGSTVVLRRAARPRLASSRRARTGRRQGGGGAALAVHQTGHPERRRI